MIINRVHGGHIPRVAIRISLLAILLLVGSAGAAPYAYITNLASNNVYVIDIANNTVTATVNVGTGPVGVAVNPTGTRVYVANYGGNTVSVIDTATNTVTATVNVGTGPFGVAVNPAGTRVYVANFGSITVSGKIVSVIDTTTNTVTATVNVGTGPRGVVVDPAGTRVYVANQGSNTVSVIGTTTNTVTATVSVGIGPYGVAVNPAGTRVYVANIGSNNVSVIDTTTNTVTTTVNVGSLPVAFGQFITPIFMLGNITGQITYSNNGTGISDVFINLTNSSGVIASTTTNASGFYNFSGVTAGNYNVSASKPRFFENSTSITLNASETKEVNLMLWLKGDLNNNGVPADAGDLVLMKRASIGEIPTDSKYDLNNNGVSADAGDLVLMKRASIGEINL